MLSQALDDDDDKNAGSFAPVNQNPFGFPVQNMGPRPQMMGPEGYPLPAATPFPGGYGATFPPAFMPPVMSYPFPVAPSSQVLPVLCNGKNRAFSTNDHRSARSGRSAVALLAEMMQHPLPFSKPIPNGIRPGWRLVINGTVNANCEGFVINLMASATNDKVFHFNPRFARPGVVVRNSCINNNWGCEERDGGMPFHHLQRFEILFLCTDTEFKIAVNGSHFVVYKHRVPPQLIDCFDINANITLHHVHMV